MNLEQILTELKAKDADVLASAVSSLLGEEGAEDFSPGQLSSTELARFQGMKSATQNQIISLLSKIRQWRERDPARAAKYQAELDALTGDEAISPSMLKKLEMWHKMQLQEKQGHPPEWHGSTLPRGKPKPKEPEMANDPPVSEKQRKAMYAARAGKSTIGIPKWVGEEFVGKAKDETPDRRALVDRVATWIKGQSKGKAFADTRITAHIADLRKAYNLSPQEVEAVLDKVAHDSGGAEDVSYQVVEGAKAKEQGKTEADNPYPKNSEAARKWRDGFRGLIQEPYYSRDAQLPQAAGAILMTPEGEVLMLQRSDDGDHAGTWCWPGGGQEGEEDPEATARREVQEEVGRELSGEMTAFHRTEPGDGIDFITFIMPVGETFEPELNNESVDAGWFNLDDLPSPLHPGVAKMFGQDCPLGEDARKSSHKSVNYGTSTGSDRCDRCEHYQAAGSHCELVVDPIAPEGWCEKFSAAVSEPAPEINGVKVDRDHDGPWMSCMSKDRQTMYVNSNLPTEVEILGRREDPARILIEHEVPEVDEMEELLEEFKLEHQREPNDSERKAIYLRAHNAAGTPSERKYCVANHIDWDGWSAWCRGEEAKIEKLKPKNEPRDADVRIAPHSHGDLEVTMDAKGDPEHFITLETDGDFDWAGLVQHLHKLGGYGASREVVAVDSDDKPVKFFWDGDGADKIQSAVIDGLDVLAETQTEDAALGLSSSQHDLLFGAYRRATGSREERIDAAVRAFAARNPAVEPDRARAIIEHGTQGGRYEGNVRSDEPLGHDSALALDWSIIPEQHLDLLKQERTGFEMAFDRESLRSIDKDGRMHVARSHISKANICPYLGSEIPGYQALGLEPDKIYQLLRDPQELAKAASTFNGIQILQKHTPVNSEDHKPYDVIGATGTDSVFEEPYLDNSLHIWPQYAINDINAKVKRELSSAYRYKADMTPGMYKGERYDGVMRDIVGNHVALVEEGRAGDDVAVGDAIPEELLWATIEGAILGMDHGQAG